MNRPHLIASDLDGTLLGSDGQVSQRTRDVLAAAREAGIEVIAATGRSRHTALPKLEGVDAIRWVVCSNGGMVWDRHGDRLHLHRPIEGAVARSVMDELRAGIDGVALGWETEVGYGFDQRFLRHPPSLDELGIDRTVPEPDGTTDATKLFVAHPDVETPGQAMAALAPRLPPSITGSTSGAAFLELTASGVNKATTLASMCAERGVDEADVAAFGDHHNDLDMLAWAGRGYAMGNAHPDVHAATSLRAPSNADDGVAAVVESLLV